MNIDHPFKSNTEGADHMSSEVEQKQPKNQPKQQQHISWRRERVAELSAQGRTEREIATMLRVGSGTVGRDLAYLNKQARENLRYYIQERLPSTHQKCSNGLTQVPEDGLEYCAT